MRHILLSSIGKGQYDHKTKVMRYQRADYTMGFSKEYISSTHVYDALLNLQKDKRIDKIIFMGTAGSNWYLMYEHLFEEDSIIKPTLQYDETYALRLLQLEEESKKKCVYRRFGSQKKIYSS